MIIRHWTSTDIFIGKIHMSFGRLEYGMPRRIKFYWGKGAGYIGGWTAHLRLSPLTPHCKRQADIYGHKAYRTPIIGVTRNGNKWLI